MKAFGIAGTSGSGKTTLIERLVPVLVGQGLIVSLIKHAHHGFDIDRPGKDSYRHREAGCTEVLLTSNDRWALMHELRGQTEPSMEELLRLMSPVDVVLIEGFKASEIPKLEVFRPSVGKPPLFPSDPSVVAVATDAPALATALPTLRLSDIDAVSAFVVRHLATQPHLPAPGG